MKSLHRWTAQALLGAFFIVCLFGAPATAQWQVPDHSVPVGRGAGTTGFKFAAPGAAGQVLTSNGAAADPSFQNLAVYNPPCDPTGAVDCSAAVQAIITSLEAAKGGIVQLPCGTVKLNNIQIGHGGIWVRGCGYEDFLGAQGVSNPQGTAGTYILTTSAVPAFNLTCGANNPHFSDLAFTQTQPADGPGWAPTIYPPSIVNAGCIAINNSSMGSFTAERILFRGVYNGIQLGSFSGTNNFYVGRTILRDISGTCFSNCIINYASSDVVTIDHVHFWPLFYTDGSTPNIVAYIQANAACFQLGRMDNPIITNVFCYGTKYGFRLTNPTGNTFDILANGTFSNIGLDSVKIGFSIEASWINFNITNWVHNSPGVSPFAVGDVAVSQGGALHDVTINSVNSNFAGYNTAAVVISSSSSVNRYTFNNAKIVAYNQANSGAAAFTATTGNTINFDGYSYLISGNSGPLVSGAGTFNIGLSKVFGSGLAVADGGTGATTASAARTSLGLAIGSNVEAWDADLDCLAALSGTGILRRTGAGTCSNGTTATVAEGGTGITSGTSGGIPYYSGTSAITSSAALANLTMVVGGGAGAAPSTPVSAPTIDANGNLTVSGSSASSANVLNTQATVASGFVRHNVQNLSAGGSATAGTLWQTGAANTFGLAQITNGATFDFITGSAATTITFQPAGTTALSLTATAATAPLTTASTSPTTGALKSGGGIGAAGAIYAGSEVATGVVAVASLPTCNAGRKGARHFVTDANATTFLTIVAAGGANNVPVTCNGTNWVIG